MITVGSRENGFIALERSEMDQVTAVSLKTAPMRRVNKVYRSSCPLRLGYRPSSAAVPTPLSAFLFVFALCVPNVSMNVNERSSPSRDWRASAGSPIEVTGVPGSDISQSRVSLHVGERPNRLHF